MSNKRAEWVYLLVQAGFEEHPSRHPRLGSDRSPELEKQMLRQLLYEKRNRCYPSPLRRNRPAPYRARERETKMEQDPLETFCARPETRPDFFAFICRKLLIGPDSGK